MIVGNGLLANAFRSEFADRDDVTIFASGVSNSTEVRTAEFQREEALLLDSLCDQNKLVYFSTCSLYDPVLKRSPYTTHKAAMESLVLSRSGNVVFRLPQVVGYTSNPNTLANYIYNKAMTNESFDLWKRTTRNLIDVDDVAKIAQVFIKKLKISDEIINIACPRSLTMVEIKAAFERVLSREINCRVMDSGHGYDIDTDRSLMVAGELGISFDDTYLDRLLAKYYARN